MNLKYIIHSVNDSEYLNFWPHTSKFVKRIGFTPVLIHVTEHEQGLHETEFGLEIKIKKNNNAPTWFQAQLARLWGTQFFKDSIVMTSDIDMFLLNRDYFINAVSNYNDDCFVNLTSNAYKNEMRIPICYNVASGNTFKIILNLSDDFDSFLQSIMQQYTVSWDVDEKFLAKKALPYNKYIGLYRHFNEKWEAEKRIDRNTWAVDPQKKDEYIDCHFLRPLDKHLYELNNLFRLYDIE
jgi:hypothetical protein